MENRFLNSLYRILTKPAVILSAGVFLLVIASLIGVPMGNDEGVWAYIGRIWVENGLLPYTGAVENKATGIYILYALSHFLFGTNIWFPRIAAILSVALTGFFLYHFTRKLSNSRAAIFATAVFMLIMPLSAVDGAYAETETFMNLFRVVSFFLIFIAYERSGRRNFWLLLSGMSFGAAIAFKQIAILDIIPLFAFHFYFSQKRIKTAASSFIWLCAGALIATFVTILPFLFSGGTIADYIDGAWLILVQSGSSPHSVISRVSGFAWHFFNPYLAVLYVGVLSFVVFRKKILGTFQWVIPLLVWLAADFFAYNADGWYLAHHFKIFIPSWSIIFGITAYVAIKNLRVAREGMNYGAGMIERDQKLFFVVIITALLIIFIPFESNYYHNIRKAIKGIQDQSQEKLGLLAKEMTQPGDFIYVWGFHIGPIYYFSDRVAPSRYFSEPFLGRPGALQEIQADLAKNKPKFIFIPIDKYPLPPWLQEIIDGNYLFYKEVYGHKIFSQIP